TTRTRAPVARSRAATSAARGPPPVTSTWRPASRSPRTSTSALPGGRLEPDVAVDDPGAPHGQVRVGATDRLVAERVEAPAGVEREHLLVHGRGHRRLALAGADDPPRHDVRTAERVSLPDRPHGVVEEPEHRHLHAVDQRRRA